jgi:DNA-binding transcriptional MerR regulator
MFTIVHTVGVTRSMDRELTTAELVTESGVPVTTLRMYQQRGLLAPPQRRGRNAIYRTSHLDRLAAIRHLQQRGYSLAAIADLARRDETAIALVLDREVPALADEPVPMTLVELVQRLPAADFSLETIARTQQLGVLRIDGSNVVVTQPAFLDAGAALTAMGVPTAAILDAYEHLQTQVRIIATDFARLFDEHVMSDLELADIPTVTAQLDTLTRTAVDVVGAELRQALRDVARQRITTLTGSADA